MPYYNCPHCGQEQELKDLDIIQINCTECKIPIKIECEDWTLECVFVLINAT